MAILLGLGAALSYGFADFIGGLVSRRATIISVVFSSQVAGLVLLLVALPFFLDARLTTEAVVWGGGAGVVGAGGISLLYIGLAIGRMGAVAPITSVGAATIPLLFGLVSGEKPPVLSLVGVAIALGSIVLVSLAPPNDTSPGHGPTTHPRRGVGLAIAAGASFGTFFILIQHAGDDTGLWPIVSARAASLISVGLVGLALRRRLIPPRDTAAAVVASGGLDLSANVLYLLAARQGLVSLAAVLTSMYPAVTVGLARFVLKERLGGLQIAGLALAALGVGLIAGS